MNVTQVFFKKATIDRILLRFECISVSLILNQPSDMNCENTGQKIIDNYER